MKYRVSRSARSDLQEIDQWVLEHFGASFADKTFDRLASTFRALTDFPNMGKQIPQISLTSRFFLEAPYWIMYLPGKTLVIQRVYHAARDLSRIHRSI